MKDYYINRKTREKVEAKDWGSLGTTTPTSTMSVSSSPSTYVGTSSKEAFRIDTNGDVWSSPKRMVSQEDLDEANKKIASLEEKMKHMEETFAKTVQDLVESLAKEYDERTTNKAALDDIPF